MILIDSLQGKTGGVIQTAGSLGKILIDTLEKASGATLESYQYYNNAGIKQLRTFMAVRDLAAVRGFIGGSFVLGTDLLKHAIEDFQRSVALATETRVAIEHALSSVTPPEPVPAKRNKAVTRSIPV